MTVVRKIMGDGEALMKDLVEAVQPQAVELRMGSIHLKGNHKDAVRSFLSEKGF